MCRKNGICYSTIDKICRGRRGSYSNDKGVSLWFLFIEDCDERLSLKEPLIRKVEDRDKYNNASIVVMLLEGDFVSEYPSAKEAVKMIKQSHRSDGNKSNIGKSNIIDIALGIYHTFGGLRFAFKDDYIKDPESYKKNLTPSVRQAIIRRNSKTK